MSDDEVLNLPSSLLNLLDALLLPEVNSYPLKVKLLSNVPSDSVIPVKARASSSVKSLSIPFVSTLAIPSSSFNSKELTNPRANLLAWN